MPTLVAGRQYRSRAVSTGQTVAAHSSHRYTSADCRATLGLDIFTPQNEDFTRSRKKLATLGHAAGMPDFMRSLLSIISMVELGRSAGAGLVSDTVHRVRVELGKQEVPNCMTDILPVFQLFKRGVAEGLADVREVAEGLGDLSHIVILIHGFDSRPAIWAEELARAVLAGDRRAGLGVIVVDWQEASRWHSLLTVWQDYSAAVANTRCLARLTAKLLEQAALSSSPSSPSLHCVGHSLGAHVCGFLANNLLEERGHRMARITGLDPAGIDWTSVRTGIMEVRPMANVPHEDTRLDATDAELVDVIHTDGNFAGTMQPLGHVDFYVGRSLDSLGSSQSGCGCTDNCDHARSFQLFTESVRRPVTVTKMLRCAGPKNLSLGGCAEMVGEKAELGYWRGEARGVLGAIGVLIESAGKEMPCAGEEEEEEDSWDDWLEDTTSPTHQVATKTDQSDDQESISTPTTSPRPQSGNKRPAKCVHCVQHTFFRHGRPSRGRMAAAKMQLWLHTSDDLLLPLLPAAAAAALPVRQEDLHQAQAGQGEDLAGGMGGYSRV